jgi:hypothetical protein
VSYFPISHVFSFTQTKAVAFGLFLPEWTDLIRPFILGRSILVRIYKTDDLDVR